MLSFLSQANLKSTVNRSRLPEMCTVCEVDFNGAVIEAESSKVIHVPHDVEARHLELPGTDRHNALPGPSTQCCACARVKL